jgi:hypothetical protein
MLEKAKNLTFILPFQSRIVSKQKAEAGISYH